MEEESGVVGLDRQSFHNKRFKLNFGQVESAHFAFSLEEKH
jgi:hypothetical protein